VPKPTNALFKFFKWNLEKKWKATKTQKKNPQKLIVATQPFQCDLQAANCKRP